MKKLIAVTFFLTVFGFSYVYSQTIDGVPVKDIDAEYIHIVGLTNTLPYKVNIQIDFGQTTSTSKSKILDENGKELQLGSMIVALNFMAEYGYEFVNAYSIINVAAINHYYYVLRKKKE